MRIPKITGWLMMAVLVMACTGPGKLTVSSAAYVVWPVGVGGGEERATWHPADWHIAACERRIAERLATERRGPISKYVFRYFGREDEVGPYIQCFGESVATGRDGYLHVPEAGSAAAETLPLGPHAITARYSVGENRLSEFKFGPIL
jgi:hypothetical protein